jgi:DNA-binding transcriptional ArsR family regulator
LEVLFPKVRARVLQALFEEPLKERYVRELVCRSRLTLCTVQDELRKLSAVGIVESRSNGYQRFYRANRSHRLFTPLLDIVAASAALPQARQILLQRRSALPKRNRSSR